MKPKTRTNPNDDAVMAVVVGFDKDRRLVFTETLESRGASLGQGDEVSVLLRSSVWKSQRPPNKSEIILIWGITEYLHEGEIKKRASGGSLREVS